MKKLLLPKSQLLAITLTNSEKETLHNLRIQGYAMYNDWLEKSDLPQTLMTLEGKRLVKQEAFCCDEHVRSGGACRKTSKPFRFYDLRDYLVTAHLTSLGEDVVDALDETIGVKSCFL